MKYTLFSTGLYSTWIFSHEFNTLFDCGEGVACALRNKSFAIERVCLSHGHMDHIAGLPTLLASRGTARGDNRKPVAIFYPQGSPGVLKMKSYLDSISSLFPFSIQWHALAPEERISLARSKSYVECFRVRHGKTLSLGYRICQDHVRLKAEFRERPEIGRELARMSVSEKAACLEPVTVCLMAYSGDAMPIDPARVAGAQVLWHDATFLKPEDREEKSHATLDEAMGVARAAAVRRFFALHVSPRYNLHDIERAERARRGGEPGLDFTIVRPHAALQVE